MIDITVRGVGAEGYVCKMKKVTYVVPVVEELNVMVEQGFAGSMETSDKEGEKEW